jgi:hypothetical protein
MTDFLIGWKEIAVHLRVSEKTAARYEKLGLPVDRDPVGHPIIRKETLEAWRIRRFQPQQIRAQ